MSTRDFRGFPGIKPTEACVTFKEPGHYLKHARTCTYLSGSRTNGEGRLPERKLTAKTVQTNLITGVLTLIPLLVVWLVLDFVLSFLFAVGSPFAAGVTMFITDRVPSAERLLDDPVFHWLVAVVVALVLLYIVGAITSRMMGKKLIAFVEGLIARIPVIESVY